MSFCFPRYGWLISPFLPLFPHSNQLRISIFSWRQDAEHSASDAALRYLTTLPGLETDQTTNRIDWGHLMGIQKVTVSTVDLIDG
jgi:hypothetical protein